MCVSVCQCKNCRNLYTKKVGLDCTNCTHLWSNTGVDCTFGKGVQTCPYYVPLDIQTPTHTTPEFRKPVPAPAPMSLYKYELLPCPFCGGKAQIVNAQKPFERRRRFFVTCLVCRVEMPRIARSREEATKVWNRRQADEPWCKENPHVIAHPVVHQPTKSVDSDPPNCGSSVQKPKKDDRAERFFTAEEVRAMSQKEVRENYQAILQSMSKWK